MNREPGAATGATAGRRFPISLAGAAGLLLFAVASGTLWAVSRGRWSDALIDSGREWIVPDALARGRLLYRDVVYWFGPLSPYFQSAFFRVLGSGFPSLVAAGVVTTAAGMAVLFFALRRVTGRREGMLWTALALPALFFMPNAGSALLGMGYRIWQAAVFALAAVAISAHGRWSRRRFGPAIGGALAGLSGLCRTEWGLAALAAVLLAATRGRGSRGERARAMIGAVLGFLATFGIGLGVFLAAAGPKALLDDGHVLLGRLPPETKAFLVAFSGIRDWPRGLAELAYSTAMWVGLALLVETVASRGADRRPLRALWVTLGALAIAAVLGGGAGAVIWSAAPAISAAALVCGLRLPPGPRSAALAAFGLLGLVLSYRRPFHIGDSAYTGPPLLFAFVSAAGLIRLRAARRTAPSRRRLARAFAAVLVLGIAAAFAARLVHYGRWEGDPIPGTGEMLTARSDVAREIGGVARLVRQRTRASGGLAVFPEGEVLNFLSGRSNPIRHQLYLPGYLTESNEADVLRELEQTPPAAVVIWLRPTSEYSRGLFGVDYGRTIREWIDRHYALEGYRAPGAPARVHPRFVVGFRRERP